jgi:signal peptidase I
VRAEAEEALPLEKEHQKKKHAKSRANERLWNEVVSWFWVIMAFLVIEGALVQARVIPSGSMEPTVLIGDHLIVSRIGYDIGIPFTSWHVPLWRNPKRQQIIVFRAPLADQGYPDFIKRVIGVPGDRIKIVEGQVLVNGVRLNEPYVQHVPGFKTFPSENFPADGADLPFNDRPEWAAEMAQDTVDGELVVPPKEYFMMGDNRDNSNDSRFWGFVPRANIIGTPLIIYMSIDAPEEVWNPGHIGERFETYAEALIHPSEIRWRRLFHTF